MEAQTMELKNKGYLIMHRNYPLASITVVLGDDTCQRPL